MNRLYLLLLCITTLISCQTPEEKAEVLINEYMFKHLHDYESYEVVETQIDSCYTSIYNDREIRRIALEIKDSMSEVEEYQEEMSYAKEIMSIWDGWDSYSRTKYNDAKEDFEEAALKFSEAGKTLNENLLYIKNASTEFTHTFIGWEVMHSFRSKTLGGASSLSRYIFFIDEKFTSINDVKDEEDIENDENIHLIIDLAISSSQEELEKTILTATENINRLKK